MRILDLFCGAGGAAMGLHQAFTEAEIYGVDIKPQPRYPFKFYQGDVKSYAIEQRAFSGHPTGILAVHWRTIQGSGSHSEFISDRRKVKK